MGARYIKHSSVSFTDFLKKKSPKYNSPVGSCEEANLVSRIPAPSINASRIPPMAAEPNMATGPSMDKPRALID